MKISIVTPWLNGTADLLADWLRATEGAERIIVDNGSDADDAAALRAVPGAVYLRNDTNAGFAAANNQGYAAATGDVVVFLNSDVAPAGDWLAAVAADVRDGALYGPSLAAQLVAGAPLPYLEGWCVAATRTTWERVWPDPWDVADGFGPWDADAYPGPYWEDNDLCLRAIEQDCSLTQTQWPIQHKGGRTAGALLRHAETFAKNEHTFTARVLPLLPRIRGAMLPATAAQQAYLSYCNTPSDIQHHLPLLYALAKGDVLELGTRSGVSTAALLAGVECHGGHVWSVDLDERSAQVAAGHPQWTFTRGDSTAMGLRMAMGNLEFDLILIDTLHFKSHVARELVVWADTCKPGGHICVHDTETFPGVRAAVEAFCAERGWPVTFVLPCNGMAWIARPV